jgi:hypothetical protein
VSSRPRGNVWPLWKAASARENHGRADERGAAIVCELDSVEDARIHTDEFPLTKAGFSERFFSALTVPLPIESLFRGEIDAAGSFGINRTTTKPTRKEPRP